VRQYYNQSRFDPATGVTVGVIDSGVGPHVDLNIIGGFNMTRSGGRDDYGDRYGHGTFVAGLIGSKGKRYPKLRGLAPGVWIQAYRVFGGGFGCQAANSAFLNAMTQAQKDQCDIINLSLEDGSNDDCLKQAITDARDQGMLVVVAAGNDDRKAVNYPAAFPGAIAVSAMGCEGTFPRRASDEAMVEWPPRGKNPKEFIAAFSNCGNQISASALGIGVLSTLHRNRYGECCGTSMAAPVVAGAAASLLSQNPNIYNMPRNRARSDAIEQLLLKNCIKRGFGPKFEGHGMPDPAKV
jgi:subtilisin